jgi:hypothetical protein
MRLAETMLNRRWATSMNGYSLEVMNLGFRTEELQKRVGEELEWFVLSAILRGQLPYSSF